jgi:hypothetical protein
VCVVFFVFCWYFLKQFANFVLFKGVSFKKMSGKEEKFSFTSVILLGLPSNTLKAGIFTLKSDIFYKFFCWKFTKARSLAHSENFQVLLPPTTVPLLVPVALHCVGPVGDLVVELDRLPVPDHVVAAELIDIRSGVGHSVPLLCWMPITTFCTEARQTIMGTVRVTVLFLSLVCSSSERE